jgi:hypothetical protein
MPTMSAAKPQPTEEQWLKLKPFITHEYLSNGTPGKDLVTSLQAQGLHVTFVQPLDHLLLEIC